MEETNIDSNRKVGGSTSTNSSISTSTSIETVERSKEPSPKALKEFEDKKKEIYDAFKSEIIYNEQQLLKKTKSIEELDRTWKKDPRYTTEINKFISSHPELQYYKLNSDNFVLKPPVSTSSGATIIMANKDKLIEEVASELGLSEEQRLKMIEHLTAFDKDQRFKGVYQKIKVNGEWEIDTTPRRKSLLKTEAERIIKEWKDAEQKQIDEHIAQELAQREKEEARVNAEKQAEAKKLAANIARYGLTIENLRKHIDGTIMKKDDPEKIIPDIYSKVLSFLQGNLNPRDREFEMIKTITPILKDYIEKFKPLDLV